MRRRDFLRRSAAAPLFLPARVFGANDRIRVGFIGLGGRARWLLGYDACPARKWWPWPIASCRAARRPPPSIPAATSGPSTRTTARCSRRRSSTRSSSKPPPMPACWCAMQALQAGLDVYAEKPLTLTVAEGRILERAVRKYKRILQTGTQQRSMPINVYASKLVREGAIGKVHTVVACNFLAPRSWEPKDDAAVPGGARLGRVVQPDRAAALPQGAAPPLGALAGLRRRRPVLGRQRLGHARARPGAGGARHRRHRPRRNLARGARPEGQGDDALRQRHAAEAGGADEERTTRNSAPSSSATRAASRSSAAISSPTGRN